MLKALSGTVLSKALVAVLNLLVISLAGRLIGAEAVGTISLVVLGITIIMLVNNFVGGGALTFLVPRFALGALLPPAYLWAIFSGTLGFILVGSFNLVPAEFVWHVALLALLQAIYTIHLQVLLGYERLMAFNLINALQVVVLFVVFYVLIQKGESPSVHDYITATYAAFGTTLVVSTILLVILPKRSDLARQGALRAMTKQGSLIQVANIFQLMAYRLNYYFIERFLGLAPVGVFTVGTQLSEGAWMVPKSIATVLYMKVSNTSNEGLRDRTAMAFMQLALAAASAVLLVLWFFSQGVFQWAFGDEIVNVPVLIRYLTPGIVAMAGAQALSHYYSGVGLNHVNMRGSGLAMLLTIAAGVVLVPRFGLKGAAITSSIAYTALYAYQLHVFLRKTGFGLGDLIPTHNTIALILQPTSDKTSKLRGKG